MSVGHRWQNADLWGAGTNIDSHWVRAANNELIAKRDPEHLHAQILLTDGEDSYDHTLTHISEVATAPTHPRRSAAVLSVAPAPVCRPCHGRIV